MDRLDNAVRNAYRTSFTQALADGRAKPLLIPYSLLGAFFVPMLWLTIPHTRRPWLYQTRWLVMAFVVMFNVNVARHSSSTNMACAYAAGLMAAWGTISSMNLLIWKRSQFEAARTIRVPRAPEHEGTNGTTGQDTRHSNQNGLRRHKSEGTAAEPTVGGHTEDDKEVFVWQPFPAEASFSERFGWALDLTCSFRCSGWNWSISSIPRPQIPHQVRPGDLVDLSSMPRVTESGYERCLTEHQFTCKRLVKLAAMYLILDFLSVFMMKDPYFIVGPDNSYELPPRLRGISPWLLLAYREVFCLAGVLSAIEAVFGLNDLVQYWLFKSFFPSRAALWQHASTFGSFSNVLDRGLAGWWGGWWHQTFRQQFLAPSTYMLRHGYLEKGTRTATIVVMFMSFLQSGLLHASGSISSIPKTKPWRSPAFFLLQAVGIMVQEGLAKAIRQYLPRPPWTLTRAANLLFTVVWLYLTAGLFIDDIASTGLWLLEPVPISPLRWLGFGHPTDHWWRWDRDHFPKWYSGGNWWDTGIAL
ncbi:hypothetical protein TOPH_05854 [Tolypocladium ophioglossoides CBS 100239]|uniref:Wax synthase domain-containing protein n=1 Tax=Tolypocladium ophioglossoides (strain CBS 100239) TaxID=1163406 RepID=A0A0L0N624_TOLOC|nr:hypothetical protein TOPH_05854 [Tolypocladium ophioglossoides CBS 100239]